MSMLNKRIFLMLLSLSIFPICALDKTFYKFEYDLSDYLPHVDGNANVKISKINDEKVYVDMFFYTSLYKVHYFIEVFSMSIKGYSEKITYEDSYNSTGNIKIERLENFSCDVDSIKDLSSNSRKFIEIAVELIKESKDSLKEKDSYF